ncbi:MAG: SMC-Scp complex subunit ScpB [Clostridiales bacterium]|jgi:segregation and condensation protein B|nr:SMC-Scp complex subunit ScpB [Clostridiales bacterium]
MIIKSGPAPEEQAVLFDAAYIKASLEAMLFASGEAVEVSRMAKALGVDVEEVFFYLSELMDEYGGKGIELVRLEDKFQFRTNPVYYGGVKSLLKLPEKKMLTGVLLETLAIVAFMQPVTKAQIEELRGLSADHAVNRLLELGLIREAGRLDAPGRPILLATTEEFLRRFEVSNLDELKKLGLNEE